MKYGIQLLTKSTHPQDGRKRTRRGRGKATRKPNPRVAELEIEIEALQTQKNDLHIELYDSKKSSEVESRIKKQLDETFEMISSHHRELAKINPPN
ncbi:MAG: hypothetical protein ABIA04_00150 [Pseudomonadota bacterium]